MARDFIYELKELKRFSDDEHFELEKERDLDDILGMAMVGKLKKKNNKCTQTV